MPRPLYPSRYFSAVAIPSSFPAGHIVIVSILDVPRGGIALGGDAYLTKPIDRERMIATLSRLCAAGAAG
jgi:hypothetical protein